MTSAVDRWRALEILDVGMAAGARARELATVLGVGLSTLQRWRGLCACDGDGLDGRKDSYRKVSHHLTDEELQRILLTYNQSEFASLPPGQIVSILAEQGLDNPYGEDFVYGPRCFYRVLHDLGQAHSRREARLPQEPRAVPQL